MKYAVTGGAGFVGSHIVKKLNEEKHEVVVIDNLNTGKLSNLKNIENMTFVKGDIRDFQLLRESCKSVDGIFHQAALANVNESFSRSDEYFDVNVKGTKNILEAKRNH